MGLQRALRVLLPGGSEGGSRARACGEHCQTGCAIVSLLGGGAPPAPWGLPSCTHLPLLPAVQGWRPETAIPHLVHRQPACCCSVSVLQLGEPQEPVLPPSTPPLHTGGLCSLLLTRSHLLPFRESPCGPGHQRRHDRIISGDTGNESRRPLSISSPPRNNV